MRQGNRYKFQYSPDQFVDDNGKALVADEDGETTGKEAVVTRKRQMRYKEKDPDEEKRTHKRVRKYLAERFTGNPMLPFCSWDLNSIMNNSEWYASTSDIKAVIVIIQFVNYKNDEMVLGKKGRSAKSSSSSKSSKSTSKAGMNKKTMFYVESVMDVDVRLRQLKSRHHAKADTHIHIVMEIHNYDPRKNMTVDMYNELMSAKCTPAVSSSKGGAKISSMDTKLMSLLCTVHESIRKGERKYMMVVCDILLGDIGKNILPNSHNLLKSYLDSYVEQQTLK